MKKQLNNRTYIFFIAASLFFGGCQPNAPTKQKLEAVNYEQLFSTIKQNDDKLYVVNFWATWCGPCMEELPHFIEVDEEYRNNKGYQMILVSLDKSTSLNDAVLNVVNTMKIKPDVLLLDDNKRQGEWIDMVNKNWDGAIPVTALYKNRKRLENNSQKRRVGLGQFQKLPQGFERYTCPI